MREQFELWFKTTKACESLEEMNYFKMDLFHFIDERNEYRHSSVQIAFMTWQARQAEINQLQNQINEMAEVGLSQEAQIIWLKSQVTTMKHLVKSLRGEHDSLDVAQNTVNTTETPYAGQRVTVDFISESSTEFSGKRFCGEGVIDRLEDGFIFGRLDSGAPFLCLPSDIEVLT